MDRKTKMANLKVKMCKLLHIVFESQDNKTLVNALNQIYRNITNYDIVELFEDSRYLLTTSEMQTIKEIHYNKPTWKVVYPIYKNIFADLYADIDPDTSTLNDGAIENMYYPPVNCKTVKHKTARNSTRKNWKTYIKKFTGIDFLKK